MTKLQMIKRANGTHNFSINIPLKVIEFLGWEKGTEVEVKTKILEDIRFIIISKGGTLKWKK